jgi:hypothetical protein
VSGLRGLIWRVLKDAVDGFWRNDGSALAGYIAFTGLLSIFPFLIFVTMLIGTLIGEERSDELTHALFEIAPSHVAMTLEPVVQEVISGASERMLTISALFAVWVASNAVESFRVSFDRAYRVTDPRGFFHAGRWRSASSFSGRSSRRFSASRSCWHRSSSGSSATPAIPVPSSPRTWPTGSAGRLHRLRAPDASGAARPLHGRDLALAGSARDDGSG